MRIRTVIVDDEPLGRQALADLCAREQDLDIVAQCGSGAEALAAVRANEPALMLLDVQMRPMSGVEVARALSATRSPHVVFVTAFDRYAVDAFELQALDYLLKPVDPVRFARTVARLRRNGVVQSAETQREALKSVMLDSLREWQAAQVERLPARIAVEQEGRVQFIEPLQIECLEAQGNYVVLHAGEHDYTVRATLTEIESRLPARRFLRLHRSVIVNVARIRSMERHFCGEFDVELDSRRRYRTGRQFRRQIQEFLLRTKSARS